MRVAPLGLALVVGVLLMSHSGTAASGATPMQGPDYVFGTIASWSHPANQDATLTLQDSSQWRVGAKAYNHEAIVGLVEVAVKKGGAIFISGDRQQGIVDRVAVPRKLAALEVGQEARDGRLTVTFAGPPSIYFLRVNRPWYARALALLQQGIMARQASGGPYFLVSIDTPTGEVVDVRPEQ